MLNLPVDEEALTRKRNRAKKLSPKKHKITHEHGRSTKTLWRHIVGRAQTTTSTKKRKPGRKP